MKFLQKLGKSLMLPVAVLPVCGILMGIGYILCPATMQGGDISGLVQQIGFLMVKAGGAIIDNMAWLFVIGVSLGMADDNHGSACLSGIASWLVITTIVSVGTMSVVWHDLDPASSSYIAYSKIQNPFIGILSGLIGSSCYNKFKGTKLPDAFAFFSGRRSVAIITVLISLLVSFVLVFVWPILFTILIALGESIVDLGPVGAGIYAFLNRLLIPTGLHHALNNVFWFDTIGLGDLTNFWAGRTSNEVSWDLGMYMSGFFPCMMFGIPGAAIAMYQTARDRKKAFGILFSSALCAFLCGLTEPFEFCFMFTAFPLYVVYSLLYGIFTVITNIVGFRAGFCFSAGATDLIFSSSMPAAKKTFLIIPLGLAAFCVYYLIFRFAIKKFNLMTLGREEDSDADAESAVAIDSASEKVKSRNSKAKEKSPKSKSGSDKYATLAAGILSAVGERENVISADCCATRLRLELNDSSIIDEKAVKAAGGMGVIKSGPKSAQIIIGTTVQQVHEEFCELLRASNVKNPDSGSDKAASGSDKAASGSGKADSGSDKAASSSDKADSGSDKAPSDKKAPAKKKYAGTSSYSTGTILKRGNIVTITYEAKAPIMAPQIPVTQIPVTLMPDSPMPNPAVAAPVAAPQMAVAPVTAPPVEAPKQAVEQMAVAPVAVPPVEAPVAAPIEAPKPPVNAPMAASAPGVIFTYRITDPHGIHARPAGMLANILKQYKSEVTIACGPKSANARSLIDLMSLGAAFGSEITVKAEGEDAGAASAAVKDFLEFNL